eukprot:scaffold10934_cov71-Phaeocystis_antarctica.AAC.5
MGQFARLHEALTEARVIGPSEVGADGRQRRLLKPRRERQLSAADSCQPPHGSVRCAPGRPGWLGAQHVVQWNVEGLDAHSHAQCVPRGHVKSGCSRHGSIDCQ